MKGILVAFAMLPVASLAADISEVPSGAFELSGGAGLSFSTGSTETRFDQIGGAVARTDSTDYRLQLTGLYHVRGNVAVGAALTYDGSSEKYGGAKETISAGTIGPAISLQTPVGSRMAVFGRGTVGFAMADRSATGEPDIGMNGIGVTLQAGLKFFVAERFSLDAGLSYVYLKMTSSEIVTSQGSLGKARVTASRFGGGAGVSVYFGG